MLEFLICALFTILPDYLIKRFVYKKRWGAEITFFTVWYELRWGITSCLILTIALITLIFYYHPSTTNATPMFRTLTILPEAAGRVEEVLVKNNQFVAQGDPLFSLDSAAQEAAVETARSALDEIAAASSTARANLDKAKGVVATVQTKLDQAQDEHDRNLGILKRESGAISEREIERSESHVMTLQSERVSAMAARAEVLAHLETVLPAQQETAEDNLAQATVALEKTMVYADVSGQLTQFILEPGDFVNPLLRPAGLLLPTTSSATGGQAVHAGFNQLAAPVIKPGTLAEITCLSKPFVVVPMVVTHVQTSIAAGQLRPTDTLVDLQDRAKPGTLTVRMEPLWENGLEGIVPGTKCIANAYSNYHQQVASGELGTVTSLYYHMVDAVGLVHAAILRVQALIIPVKMLVFSGH